MLTSAVQKQVIQETAKDYAGDARSEAYAPVLTEYGSSCERYTKSAEYA